MEKIILYGLGMVWLIYPGYAEYYEITTNVYTPGQTLQSGDELYMSDGGFDSLTLLGNSVATIEGTSPLQAGTGGIWFLTGAGTSRLKMSGGQVNQLDFYNEATAVLSGGTINQIKSNQQAKYWDNDNAVWILTPHIQIFSDSYAYDENTGLLKGNWLSDGTAFSIQLIDVDNFSPAFENIEFVPEPATLLLLTLGGLLIHRTKKTT